MKNILRVAEGLFINTILIILLVCPGLYGAEDTLPTPEEIIAKNIETMGGKEAFKKIKNKKMVQIRKYNQMNRGIKDTIYQERPNNFYVVMDTGIREGADGKMAWMISPRGARLIEGNNLARYLREHSFDGFDGPDASYKTMKTEGIEQINGKGCYKVVKTPEKGTERTVYYDKNNFMIVKDVSYFKNPQGENTKVEICYEDYKKINGILFPYKEMTFVNGQKSEEKTIEKIELNIEMPEGIFDIPEEIKAIMNKNETEQHAQQ